MKNKNNQNQKGFTLIELLIVIAIIGILAAVLIVIINPAKQRQRAQDGVLVTNMSKLAATISSYYTVKNKFPETFDGCTINCELLSEAPSLIYANATGSGSRTLWVTINGVKTGYSSDLIRYEDYDDGCISAGSNEFPGTKFYVWKLKNGLELCDAANLGVACDRSGNNTYCVNVDE